MAIYIDGVRVSGGGGTAADVPYDNTDSGLTATDVQEAIDELADNAGSSTLSGLSDVTITSPTTDQVLKYDGSKWVNGTGENSPVVFSVNASHPNNPTTYDIVVTVGGSTVFSKNYSCTIYGVFAQDTDTFTYNGTTYTVLAQGYQANNGQKMLDFSIDDKSYSVYCSTTNSSYATNDTFTLVVGGSGGVSDYEDLTNKPQVNGVTLSGDKDSEDLGIVWEGTQSQYDAIVTKDPNTTYYITDADDGGDSFQPIIYSEIEREIGVYIDGKPLYEKSYYVAQLPSVEDNVDIANDITNLGEVISLTGIMINSTSHMSIQLPYNADYEYGVQLAAYETYVRISVHTNRSAWKSIITLRYTKTTDIAGSGTWTPQGVPAVHYSTNEQVVGTWIDGSTLYQTTLQFNLPSTANWTKAIQHNLNIDTYVSYSGFIKTSAVTVAFSSLDPAYNSMFYFYPNNIYTTTIGNDALSQSCIMTLRYTKSSS
jgi:hypothetical protein